MDEKEKSEIKGTPRGPRQKHAILKPAPFVPGKPDDGSREWDYPTYM